MLKNIRQTMIDQNLLFKTVSPELIDQIYQFEALNDIKKKKHLDDLFKEHCLRLGIDIQDELAIKRKRASRAASTNKDSIGNGSFISTVSQQKTINERD